MDVPRTQAPEHVPDDVLDLAVPSADVSLTPPLVGANAPARLSLTKLALHPANTEDAWNGGIRPHRPATEPATTPVSPDGPYGMEVRVVAGGSYCPRVLGGRHRGCRAVGAVVLRRPPPALRFLARFGASFLPASVFRNTDFLLSRVAPKNQIFDRDRWRKVTSPWTLVMIMRSFMIEYGRRSGNKRRPSRCWL